MAHGRTRAQPTRTGFDTLRRIGGARIGCSGWEYKHWRGDFYPAEIKRTAWFDYYASRFDTVEINNSFYRLPEVATFKKWAERAPSRFRFAVKASRYLTHLKKLKEPEQPVERLFNRMRELGPHLGPVLYQLPPNFKLDRQRLEHFLHVIPADVLQVVEFRDPSWYTDDVSALLERHQIARCLHDMKGSATGHERVGPFVYVRFHGASGTYTGDYSDARLERWAEWLTAQRRAGVDVYAYFNNDVGGHAPRNAMTLRRLVEDAI